jgi:hypothetical protein
VFLGTPGNTHTFQGTAGCDFHTTGTSGFIGPGARITTHDRTLRFTSGLAFGAAIRKFEGHWDCGSSFDNGFDQSSGYVDPALMFDAGILIGGMPGAQFSLGVVAWGDFPGKQVVVGPDTSPMFPDAFFTAPNRGYLLASGPQIFIGPALGLQVGH